MSASGTTHGPGIPAGWIKHGYHPPSIPSGYTVLVIDPSIAAGESVSIAAGAEMRLI